MKKLTDRLIIIVKFKMTPKIDVHLEIVAGFFITINLRNAQRW